MNHEEASIGLAVLGGRKGAFAEQADVRKKVLWGQWAECALAGARNRETLRTNGGDALGVCARAVTARHSASRPRDGRNIAKDRTIKWFNALSCLLVLHHRPALPSSAAQRTQTQMQKKRLRENDDSTHEEGPNSSE